MIEEILHDNKSWGIEDAVEKLEKEVEQAKLMVETHRAELDKLMDKYMSLSVGLKILQNVYKEYQSSLGKAIT